MEIFNENDIEVLYTYEPVDDYIFSHLHEYKDKKLQSADQADLDLPTSKEVSNNNAVSDEEVQTLTSWLKDILKDKVKEVKKSTRLVESPAIVLSPEGMSHSMQKMMRLMNKNMDTPGTNVFEINLEHPIIVKLNEVKQKDEEFAKMAAEQIYDNALMSAGLLNEYKDMINRTYKILDRALEK
jgi:molecular chaperone HtpG